MEHPARVRSLRKWLFAPGLGLDAMTKALLRAAGDLKNADSDQRAP